VLDSIQWTTSFFFLLPVIQIQAAAAPARALVAAAPAPPWNRQRGWTASGGGARQHERGRRPVQDLGYFIFLRIFLFFVMLRNIRYCSEKMFHRNASKKNVPCSKEMFRKMFQGKYSRTFDLF